MLDTMMIFIFEIGYIGFFFYMLATNTFLPFPPQLVLFPAGYLAAQGQMDFITVSIITTAGTLAGALVSYYFANFIASKFFKTRKQKRKLTKIKYIFRKYGKATVLFSPVIPVVGLYVSIPAGIFRMPMVWFASLTYFSNFVWNVMMISLGYFFGEQAEKNIDYIMLGLSLVLITAFSVWGLYKLRVNKEEFSKDYYQSPIVYLHNNA